MNLPETIKIGPFTYTVSQEAMVRADDDTKLHGEIEYATQRIRISEGMADEYHRMVVLHECLHGIDNYMSIGLTEKQIRRLGVGLIAFFQDNPQLWEPVP